MVRIMRRSLLIAQTLVLLFITTVANSQSRLPNVTHEGIEVKEIWIPMPDGVRLAASLFMPADREATAKFPVLLEYLPYRKDESRKGRFALFSYFIARGYVVARVDIRGSGTSEGKLIEYEYTDQEQEDGEVVIDWLSKQAWSTGNVGMFGISWGAFNSIQMAMRNPPALKAIVAIMGTDDLFRDDVHFIDGMMHVDSYEFAQDIANILPAPPDYVIDESYFHDRFNTEPWLLIYKRQQHDGPFWNRASLNSDYSSIKIPTFVIGGWYDGYRDSVPRMLEKLDAPVKGMLGPWAHTWPNQPYPEPGMEWRQNLLGATDNHINLDIFPRSASRHRVTSTGGGIFPGISVAPTPTAWSMILIRWSKTLRSSAFRGRYCMYRRMRPWPIGSCAFLTSRPTERSHRWREPVLAARTGNLQKNRRRWYLARFTS
jgi:predicted acyl esterase